MSLTHTTSACMRTRYMHMLSRVIAQVVRFVLVLVTVSALTFALVAASPIDPVQANVGQAALLSMTPQKREQLAERWDSNEPLVQRYVSWASDALRGDLGESLRYNQPVVQVLSQRAGATLGLMALAWALSGVLGFLAGVVAGVRAGSLWDRGICGWCYLMASTPTFWLAMLALMVFSVHLGWFPVGFATPIGGASQDVGIVVRLHHLLLPAFTLAITGISNIALHTREKTIDIMASDYIRFARSRGERGVYLVWRHVICNVALPALMLQAASVSELFGGSILVEQVFSYPGLGQAAVNAGLGGDAPLLVGIALVSAAIVFVGNVVSSCFASLLDPRTSVPEVRS